MHNLPHHRHALLYTRAPDFSADFTTGTYPFTPSVNAYSRTSNATLTDSSGKITYAGNNQILYSEDFTQANWAAAGSAVKNSASSITLVGGFASTVKQLLNSTIAGTTYIFSAVVSGTPGDQFAIYIQEDSGGFPQTATTVTLSATPTRVFIQRTLTLGGTIEATFRSNAATVTFNATQMQMEQVTYETSPRAYNKTTASAYYESPRTLWVNGVASGNLLEGAATNVALYSRDLTNAAWTKTNVTAALDQTGVDGVSNSASSIISTAGNGTCLQAITLASSVRLQSAYVKRLVGTGTINMTTDGGSTWVDITSSVTSSYTLISIPAQTVTNPSIGFRIVTNGDKIAVDMVQNETGVAATSRIITYAAALTRAADTPSAVSSPLGANLSYSASSNRTIFDATGALTYAPNNLLTWSNFSSSTDWNADSNAKAITYGTLPDGSIGFINSFYSTSAGTWYPRNTSYTLVAGQSYILSVWVKTLGSDPTTAKLAYYDGSWNIGSAITLTGSWQRVYLKFTAAGASTTGVGFQLVAAAANAGLYWANFQLEAVTYQTTPSAYNATLASAYYGPALDYNTSGVAQGLRVEEARTNVALYSRDLTNAAWTTTNVTAAKDQTGIDGAANSASSIVATAGNGTVLQAVTLASSQRFQTAYVKRLVGTGVINMTTDGGATWTAITVTSSWTRVSIPAQTVTNPSLGFQIVTNGDKIAVDCVQNETGSFATSFIPTYGSALTRAADLATFSSNILTIAKAQGSLIAEVGSLPGITTGQYPRIVGSDLGSDASLIYIDTGGTKAGIFDGTHLVPSLTVPSFVGNTSRVGVKWSASYISAAADNTAVQTGAFNNGLSAATTLYVGRASASNYLNAPIRSIAVYNVPLNDGDLTRRSTVGAPY